MQGWLPYSLHYLPNETKQVCKICQAKLEGDNVSNIAAAGKETTNGRIFQSVAELATVNLVICLLNVCKKENTNRSSQMFY